MERKKLRWIRGFRLFALTVLAVFLCGMSAMAASQTVTMTKDSDGKLMYIGEWEDSSVSVYHKITVSRPSLLTVTGCRVTSYGRYGITVKLCNSKKGLIDAKAGNYVDSERKTYVQYALLKGTYYIKTSGVQNYVLVASVDSQIDGRSISDKGGAVKSNAREIKAGKTLYGAVAAGEKAGKADWYKIKVSKSRVLYFDLEAAGSSKVSFTLYGPSYPKGIRMSDLKNDSASLRTVKKNSWGLLVGDSKVKKGTYYIKVERTSGYREKRYSALYSIRWR